MRHRFECFLRPVGSGDAVAHHQGCCWTHTTPPAAKTSHLTPKQSKISSLLPATTRSPWRKGSHADAWSDRVRSAGESRTSPPASPRLDTEVAGRSLGGFLVQIFPRHRRTAHKAEAEGVQAIVVDNIHKRPFLFQDFLL